MWITQLLDILKSFTVISHHKLDVLYELIMIYSVANTVGAALNVSFLWIEMSASKKIRRIKNLSQTRGCFFFMEIFLIASCVILVAVFSDIRLVLILIVVYAGLIGTSYIIGARSMGTVLHESSGISNQGSGELHRMILTATGVAWASLIVVMAGIVLVYSFNTKSSVLGFLSFAALKLALLNMLGNLLWYLRGLVFSPLGICFGVFKSIVLKFTPTRVAVTNLNLVNQSHTIHTKTTLPLQKK